MTWQIWIDNHGDFCEVMVHDIETGLIRERVNVPYAAHREVVEGLQAEINSLKGERGHVGRYYPGAEVGF